ncbi:hypothetical protein [Loktanella sp. S4079]|uniref:hypothetical protein n=1 Tax=Loktanella sp. S4079 TaxID=579483 RepID=UPI0005FA42EA|nr:hypothetical protein [Loktanella sp. S4079]KJZ18572.1 hypothetical protein TW80_14240 [Loktanella sp. S4079]
MTYHAPYEQCYRTPLPKEIFRKDADFDEIESQLLTVMRLYFQAFAAPESHAWIGAMDWAEAQFGPTQGPIIAARVLAALMGVRRTRQSVFRFSSPTCPDCAAIVTEHERRFMAAVCAVRRGQVGAAQTELMMLCEGNDTGRTIDALKALRAVLPNVVQPQDQNAHV